MNKPEISHAEPRTSSLTPAPTAADPTFATFTDDADNPYAPQALDYEPWPIPGTSPDEYGYRVGNAHALVRITRPRDPAASMYGCTAIAFAVDGNGRPVLRPSGDVIEVSFTRMLPKADLLPDPTSVAQAMRKDAVEGALRELLIELAVVGANDAAFI